MRRYIFYTKNATPDINLYEGERYESGDYTAVVFPTFEAATEFDSRLPGSGEGWISRVVDEIEDGADPTIF